MNKIIRIGLALLVLATVSVRNARAEDPIAAWNQISEKAVKTAGRPPPVAALDFAIVHLAIYDAVESIERRYEPYYTLAPGAIHYRNSDNTARAQGRSVSNWIFKHYFRRIERRVHGYDAEK
jgi:hypothetical protein